MTKITSFEADIRPLFTEQDIQGMKKGFNLASYDEVKSHAAAIYDRIRGIGGAVMPPPPPMRYQTLVKSLQPGHESSWPRAPLCRFGANPTRYSAQTNRGYAR